MSGPVASAAYLNAPTIFMHGNLSIAHSSSGDGSLITAVKPEFDHFPKLG